VRHVLVLVVLTLGLAGAACSSSSSAIEIPTTGGPNETAEQFFTRLLAYDSAGQWGRTWDFLHPAHQRLVPRKRYIECSELVGGFRISDVETETVRQEPIDWEGIPSIRRPPS
jgi:hypothetical protein